MSSNKPSNPNSENELEHNITLLLLKVSNIEKQLEEVVRLLKKDSVEASSNTESTENAIMIGVWRTETAKSTFPSFENELETRLNEYRKEKKKTKSWSLWPFGKNDSPVQVKSFKGLDSIPPSIQLMIICAFSPTVRVEAETVLPSYELLNKNLKCKIQCVVFRYGEGAAPAKISDTGKSDDEVLPSLSFYFDSSGLLNIPSNNDSISALFQVLKS